MHTINRSRILQADEVSAVISDLKRKLGKRPDRSQTLWVPLVVFRLSCCCGLRRKEIAGLEMRDIVITGPKPYVHVRADNTKAGRDGKCRQRQVALWWSAATRDDIRTWYEKRVEMGATARSPFVCCLRAGHVGNPVTWSALPGLWETSIRVLGRDRQDQLSIHCGRHSFISHALAAGRSLAEVRDCVGHRNISTTNIYTHSIDTQGVPDVFSV